jgi:hypothetical protein
LSVGMRLRIQVRVDKVRVDIKPVVGASAKANDTPSRSVDGADICCMIA